MLKFRALFPMCAPTALVVCCALSTAAWLRADVGADAPSPATVPTKPVPVISPERAAQNAIAKAVSALGKAWSEGGRNAASFAKLSTTPDYFTAENSADVNPEAIVNALGQPMGRSAAESCYIKAELLSAINGKFDEKLAEKGLLLYTNAPKLVVYPDAAPAIKAKLEQALSQIHPGDEEALVKLNDEFTNQKELDREQNKFIIMYRDALFARLPFSASTIMAGWGDYVERVKSGVETSRTFYDTMVNATRAYSNGDNVPGDDLRRLADGLTKINAMSTPGSWKGASFDAKDKKAVWSPGEQSAAVGGEGLKALIKELRDHAVNGAALKFKPEG